MLLSPLLVVHVVGGSIALASGVTAMIARKGARTLHTRAGTWFFGSMLVMAATAALLTRWEPDPLSLFAAILTLYLVATSWMAARGRGWRRYEWAAMPVALASALALAWLGFTAAQSVDGTVAGKPPQALFIFAGLAILATLLDLNALLRARLSQRQRIARHLWRMCTAFFLAATSLFLGQQDSVFPFMEGSPLLFVPSLATLMFMAFWIVRVRFAKQWLRPAKPVPAKAAPATA
jgi:hypothetical protein